MLSRAPLPEVHKSPSPVAFYLWELSPKAEDENEVEHCSKDSMQLFGQSLNYIYQSGNSFHL